MQKCVASAALQSIERECELAGNKKNTVYAFALKVSIELHNKFYQTRKVICLLPPASVHHYCTDNTFRFCLLNRIHSVDLYAIVVVAIVIVVLVPTTAHDDRMNEPFGSRTNTKLSPPSLISLATKLWMTSILVVRCVLGAVCMCDFLITHWNNAYDMHIIYICYGQLRYC